MAQSTTARETVCVRRVMEFMGYGQEHATTLYQDNSSAIVWAEEGKYSGKAKHIDVRYHYTTEKIKHGLIKIEYLSTLEMLADILTKILPGPALKRFRLMLGLKEI
eukprot:Plantae.Rhodophyta-Palmaria_palmata.ctg1192.p1 GENE.Plantae.Rhodophyta-Palmaria_palmata.ctg1192~~Plantae.Rhodophyta-Palmaria_palmata.ctg1192.p1  ORF type:complete len:106 (-),score=7.06 Plantae.Rhodophyta-Palmaria_palmata.ctg1192:203-520(-)